MVVGFFTAVLYLIAIFYSIQDLEAVLSGSASFPLASIYKQATGTNGGALGLLIVAFLPTFITCIGCYITASRMFWTLSRDNAAPLSNFFAKVHPTFRNPFNATLLCAVFSIAPPSLRLDLG